MNEQAIQMMNDQISTYTATGEAGLSQISGAITGMFSSAQSAGIAIVVGAITIGVVFVAGAFIWGLAKSWLTKSRGH